MVREVEAVRRALAPALLLPPSSLFSPHLFVLNKNNKKLASRNNLQVSLCNYKGAGRVALTVALLLL
jgi:hypothetical protein